MTNEQQAGTTAVSHTPGPWAIGLSAGGAATSVFATDEGGARFCVAQAYFPLSASVRTNVRAEANARLIAAAPLMLEALGEGLAHFESLMSRIEDGAKVYPADRNALDARFRQMREAIAAATGEEVTI